jgi:hypothetical protein
LSKRNPILPKDCVVDVVVYGVKAIILTHEGL